MNAYVYWLFLVGAILFEVAGTTSMKLSEGLTRLLPTVLIFVFYGCALALLTLALKKVEMSMAYTIWSGLGSVLIVLISIYKFNEPFSFMKMFLIGLIVIGVIGLKLQSSY